MEERKRDDNKLLSSLHGRQADIAGTLPRFVRTTVPMALLLFAVSFAVRLYTDTALRTNLSALSIESLTIGSVIAVVLGLFSSVVVWVFVIWSLTFVPYIAYTAHKSSRKADGVLITRPLRWLQLYAATFLPMAVFATAWNSLARHESQSVAIPVQTAADFALLAVGTALVVGLLSGINKWIPPRLAALRLSFLSFLLYMSLFLTYGRGVSVASHAMVFGILIYLMFGASQVADLARRISLHDVDPKIVERVEEITLRLQDVQGKKDATVLTREEHEAEASRQRLDMEIAEATSDLTLTKQLADIKAQKVRLNQEITTVQLKVFETHIDALGKVFSVMSEEFQNRMKTELPAKLQELSDNVKGYSHQELKDRMAGIMKEINGNLQGIPESLQELRAQLVATTNELEKQTRLLSADSEIAQGAAEESGPESEAGDALKSD